MNHRAARTALLLLLSFASPGACLAAQPAAEPQMRPGYTSQPPTTPTVAPMADQIRASAAIGEDVRDTNGATVATVGDLLINRKDNAVEAAILNPAGGVPLKHGKATVVWRRLECDGKRTARFGP